MLSRLAAANPVLDFAWRYPAFEGHRQLAQPRQVAVHGGTHALVDLDGVLRAALVDEDKPLAVFAHAHKSELGHVLSVSRGCA